MVAVGVHEVIAVSEPPEALADELGAVLEDDDVDNQITDREVRFVIRINHWPRTEHVRISFLRGCRDERPRSDVVSTCDD